MLFIQGLIFCLLNKMALSLNCTVYLQTNGSALCKLSEEAHLNCGIDWAINGVNVANEDNVNTTLVIQQTRDSLLLRKYHANVTFDEDCIATGRREAQCNGPFSGVSEAPDEEDNSWKMWAGGAVCLLGLIFLAVGFYGWKKKKRCFQRGQEEAVANENHQLNGGPDDEGKV